MIVTAIEKKQGERYTVTIDGEYWAILDMEVIMQNGLRPGKLVDADGLEDILLQAERRKARERAYYLLGYRDHSEKELYDKLLGSARPEISREILELVKSQGLLNDEAYAEKLARYYLETKKWGSRRVSLELSKRGIGRETAQAAIEQCEVDAVGQIKAVIAKKYDGYLETGEYKDRQKVVAALARLGFSFDDIKTAIREYREQCEYREAEPDAEFSEEE